MCYGASRRKEKLHVSVCQLNDTIFLRADSFQIKNNSSTGDISHNLSHEKLVF